MASDEIPVQCVEWTSPRADALARVEAALGAIVAHLVDVVRAGRVGFSTDNPAIGKQPHADHVGRDHPVIGVNIGG